MKKPSLWMVLACAALILCLFFARDAFALLAMPFTLLGKGLRLLSLSGKAGNAAAIALYCVVSLLPLLLLLGRRLTAADALLPGCAALLFYVLYLMINPGLRPAVLYGPVGDQILSGAVWSLLLSWGLLRFLRRSDTLSSRRLYRALHLLVRLCMCIFAASVAAAFSGARETVRAIADANTMPGLRLNLTYGFVYLQFAVTALEYILDCVVLQQCVTLLHCLQADAYSESTCLAASKVSHRCRQALYWTVLSSAALNVGQLIFASRLHNLAASFHIPVLSITLLVALLVLTRLLEQGKQLKEDNDLFI